MFFGARTYTRIFAFFEKSGISVSLKEFLPEELLSKLQE